MILQALRQLALDEGLVANPAYEAKAVHYEVVLGKGSRFLSLAPLGDPAVKGWNGHPQPVPRHLPGTRKSGTTIDPGFLVGNASFVLGLNAPGDADKKSFPEAELLRRRDAFRGLIDEALAAQELAGDEGLAAVAKFLADLAAGAAAVTPDPRMRSNHLLAFRYKPDIDHPVHDRSAVQAYWQRRLGPDVGAAGEPAFECLVTGTTGPAARSHPVVQRVPGGNSTGVRLVSFNAPAYTSYGLEQSHNAPVSQAAADAYTEALRRLLDPRYPDPREPGRSLDARSFRLSADTAVTYWVPGGDQAAVGMVRDALDDPGKDEQAKQDHAAAVAAIRDPKVVEAAHQAPWKGKQVTLSEADQRPFYTLTLSGAEARAVIRGWHEATLGQTLRNLRQYFADLDIARPPQDAGRCPPLLALVRQLSPRGELDKASAALAAELFQAVLAGREFPRGVLEAAVRRVRAERTIYPDRAALLKAYLCRAGLLPATRPRPAPFDPQEQFVVTNPTFGEPAYRLGQLFAVLEKLQDDAIGASAGIRDRYYGAASATPVVVFPQLLRKAPHHLSKLGGGQETYYEKLIQQVVGGPTPVTVFPSTLTLEKQGLFALGYYHQRQSLFTKRDDKTAPPTTPEG